MPAGLDQFRNAANTGANRIALDPNDANKVQKASVGFRGKVVAWRRADGAASGANATANQNVRQAFQNARDPRSPDRRR
ncbi:MAG: hypothetical protein AAFY56_18570 [Pseudomonadota bacterium]